MWTRQLLKENAKVAFRRNYWLCVAVSAIAMFLMGGGIGLNFNNTTTVQETESIWNTPEAVNELLWQIPTEIFLLLIMAALLGLVVGICVLIFVSNVIQVGCNRYFIENREHKTDVGQIFCGFRDGRYLRVVWTMFLKGLYIFLWSLLFWIPGIIKGFSYMMVPYILAENSNMDRKRVFALSENMMYGHKWEAFVLGLSFLGWNFLGALTGGILNVFYVNPYQHATYAEFYSALKAEALQKGIATTADFPGVATVEQGIPFV